MGSEMCIRDRFRFARESDGVIAGAVGARAPPPSAIMITVRFTLVWSKTRLSYACSTRKRGISTMTTFFSCFLFSRVSCCCGPDSRPVRLQAAVPRADVHVHSTAHVHPAGRGGGAGPVLIRTAQPWGVPSLYG